MMPTLFHHGENIILLTTLLTPLLLFNYFIHNPKSNPTASSVVRMYVRPFHSYN